MTSAERSAYRLGRRSFERGDLDTALTQLGSLLQTHREFADVHYMMGVLLDRKDELQEAAQSLRNALRINPSYTEALLALANIYERQGDFGRSRDVNERARLAAGTARGVLDPTTRGKLANLQATLGDAYREAGEMRDAIEAYRKALDRCPEFHDIRQRLGVALRDAGLPDRALAEFGRILRSRPDYLEAAVQLGVTLYSLGRTEEAVSEWVRVVEADASRRDARMYLRLVRSRPQAAR